MKWACFSADGITRTVCQYVLHSTKVNATALPMNNIDGQIITTTTTGAEVAKSRWDETCLRYCFAHVVPYCSAYAVQVGLRLFSLI